MNNTLVIIIPTKDRPEQIRELLASIERQSVKPQLVMIVDGGVQALGPIEREFKGLSILSIRNSGDPSLTVQRNIGIIHIPQNIELAGFLDDDIVLCDDALKNMLNFWETASQNVGGACFHIINEPPTAFPRIQEFFQIGSSTPGRVFRSGFTSKLIGFTEDTQVEWLCGGATIWRRRIFDEFRFDEVFRGYGAIEDLDFSYRVGKKYKLMGIASAKVIHNTSRKESGHDFRFGISQVANRYYFVKKNQELSIPLFFGAVLGTMMINSTVAASTSRFHYVQRLIGNFVGYLKIVFVRR